MTTRAEPVGSMLRPASLREARERRAAGELDPVEFKRIEDAAADEAIALQERAGLDVVTDGEMRRGHFMGTLSEAIDGLGDVPAAAHKWHGADEMEFSHVTAVVDKLTRARSLAQEELVYLRARASKPVKITLPSPLMMQTLWSPEHSTAAYDDPFGMFADAAAILREEVADLVALGCEYVQIDAPELALMVDDSVREQFTERGIDPERMLAEGIEIIDSVGRDPGPAVRDPPLPRQPRRPLDGVGRIRGDLTGRVQARRQLRHVLPRVRRRALRRLRAAARRARRPLRVPRPGVDQAAGA